MIVSVVSRRFTSFHSVRCASIQHIGEEITVESVVNKQNAFLSVRTKSQDICLMFAEPTQIIMTLTSKDIFRRNYL